MTAEEKLKETCKYCEGMGTIAKQDKCGCGMEFNSYSSYDCPMCLGKGTIEVMNIDLIANLEVMRLTNND